MISCAIPGVLKGAVRTVEIAAQDGKVVWPFATQPKLPNAHASLEQTGD